MTKASVFIALGVILASVLVSPAQADKLKNREFLTFSEGQRQWWYAGAFDALGHAAFVEDEAKGQCVWNWLAAHPDREALLLDSFRQYPDHAPTSILLAVLRRDCGVFTHTPD